jgi:hypothetical protein
MPVPKLCPKPRPIEDEKEEKAVGGLRKEETRGRSEKEVELDGRLEKEGREEAEIDASPTSKSLSKNRLDDDASAAYR